MKKKKNICTYFKKLTSWSMVETTTFLLATGIEWSASSELVRSITSKTTIASISVFRFFLDTSTTSASSVRFSVTSAAGKSSLSSDAFSSSLSSKSQDFFSFELLLWLIGLCRSWLLFSLGEDKSSDSSSAKNFFISRFVFFYFFSKYGWQPLF